MDYNVKSFEKKDVPMSYELLFQRAVQLHEAGQLNEAEQIYRRILETAPQQPEVLNLLGLVAQAKGVQDEACSLFYQAIRQAPARAPFYYNLAFSLKLDNKPVEALESFEKALALQPDIKEAYNEMGLICQSLGKLEQARVYWSKALEIDGDYVEAKANRAMSYSESNSSMAIEELERLAQTYKDEAVIFYYLGRLYLERGQDDKAWPAAIRAKELAPMSDEVRVVLGTLALKEGQTANAKIYFEKAVLLNEYNIAALLGLADIASRENDFEKAEKGYKRVLELAPKNFVAHNNFAELLYKQKRTAEALEEYRQAVIINPKSAEVSNNLAVILRDCGDYEQALGLLFNAYVLKPELEQISINLAETLTLYQRQQPEEALKIAENWVRQAPENIFAEKTAAAFKGEDIENNQIYSEKLFDGFADNYELVVKNLGYSVPMAVGRALGNVKASVVDLGCGTGLVGEVIKGPGVTLTGVDISAKMLEAARAKNIYDRLVQSDVVEFLYNNHNYDWAIAADVLGYIGDLKEFAAAVSGIKLIFTTELYDGTEAYKVMPNGRYKHRQDYVENLLRDNGYTKISCKKMVLRKEDGKDVNGILWKAENV